MNNIFKNIKTYPFLFLIAGFMILISVGDMITPAVEFSQLENKYLTQAPTFSVESLLKNEYTKKYESYLNDQFLGRDNWIAIKSVGEYALLKTENNGIIYGKDDYLFVKDTQLNQKQIDTNLDCLYQFLQGYTGDFTFGLIPNAQAVLTDLLPTGYSNLMVDQQTEIEKIYQTFTSQNTGANVSTLDLLTPLSLVDNAYYRTDHHWNYLGAWTAYKTFAQQNNLEYITLDALDQYKQLVPDFYGTHYSKSKNFNVVTDTIVWYDIPYTSVTINDSTTVLDQHKQEHVISGLNLVSQFADRDKYGAFLYGNNGHTVITSENNLNQNQNPSKILIIKDSYSNCMAPYFTYSYDQVDLVDLRALPTTFSKFLADNQYDHILFLYNFDSFQNENTLIKLKF